MSAPPPREGESVKHAVTLKVIGGVVPLLLMSAVGFENNGGCECGCGVACDEAYMRWKCPGDIGYSCDGQSTFDSPPLFGEVGRQAPCVDQGSDAVAWSHPLHSDSGESHPSASRQRRGGVDHPRLPLRALGRLPAAGVPGREDLPDHQGGALGDPRCHREPGGRRGGHRPADWKGCGAVGGVARAAEARGAPPKPSRHGVGLAATSRQHPESNLCDTGASTSLRASSRSAATG